MKSINIYKTHAEYDADYENRPLVSLNLVKGGSKVLSDKKACVTFIAEEYSTIKLDKKSSFQTLEYSTDMNTWNTLDIETTITLANKGDKVYLRGILDGENDYGNYTQFKMTGKIAARGNCNALWNYNDLEAPLKSHCGNGMFYNCTSLTSAPELPATKLAYCCYHAMFLSCTSLVEAPELPATMLFGSSYKDMFRGCYNLNKITCLATNMSAGNCTDNWVNGVSHTGTFIKAAGATWGTGTSGIPEGWTIQDYVG